MTWRINTNYHWPANVTLEFRLNRLWGHPHNFPIHNYIFQDLTWVLERKLTVFLLPASLGIVCHYYKCPRNNIWLYLSAKRLKKGQTLVHRVQWSTAMKVWDLDRSLSSLRSDWPFCIIGVWLSEGSTALVQRKVSRSLINVFLYILIWRVLIP